MKPYGCNNHAPRTDTTAMVQDGWYMDGCRRMTQIAVSVTNICRYDLNAVDERCTGCRWSDAAATMPAAAKVAA